MAKGKDERFNENRKPRDPWLDPDPTPPHGIPRPKPAKPYDWAEEGKNPPPHPNWWNN